MNRNRLIVIAGENGVFGAACREHGNLLPGGLVPLERANRTARQHLLDHLTDLTDEMKDLSR